MAADRSQSRERVTFHVAMAEAARADLAERHAYVRGEAGNVVADRYVHRIDKRIRALDRFPERGAPRSDLGRDIRALSFERRLLILYRVDADIVRILDAYQDLIDLEIS